MVPDRMLTTLRSPWRGNKARLWLLPILIVSVVSLCGCTKDLVTGKRTYNFFSLKTDIKMGKEVLSQQLGEFRLKGVKVDNDPEMVGRIREMVTKIAVISHIPQFPYEAHYARVPIANAWCAPGGKIMVYEGLFSEKDGLVDRNKEAELAAVLGHEIAHATCRHVVETASRNTSFLFIGQLIAVFLAQSGASTSGDLFKEVFTQGMNIYVPAYSRKNESEADRVGIIYMAKAGYDPRAAVELWKRAAAKAGKNDKTSITASHPANGERARNLEAILPQAIAEYEKTRSPLGQP